MSHDILINARTRRVRHTQWIENRKNVTKEKQIEV